MSGPGRLSFSRVEEFGGRMALDSAVMAPGTIAVGDAVELIAA